MIYIMKRVHLIVHGYVQGVFFRLNVKKMADSLELKGYAKNMTDGTVKVVAEGPQDKIKELIAYCKKGTEASEVEKVDVKFEEANSEFTNFEIRY